MCIKCKCKTTKPFDDDFRCCTNCGTLVYSNIPEQPKQKENKRKTPVTLRGIDIRSQKIRNEIADKLSEISTLLTDTWTYPDILAQLNIDCGRACAKKHYDSLMIERGFEPVQPLNIGNRKAVAISDAVNETLTKNKANILKMKSNGISWKQIIKQYGIQASVVTVSGHWKSINM